MKIFGQLVRTAVNVATLPVAVVKDGWTLFSDPVQIVDYGHSATRDKLRQLKEEASE